MYASRKHSNMSKHFFIHSLIFAAILMPVPRQIFASEESPKETGTMVLVLEDCDSDNKLSTDPYGDTASLFNSKGEILKKLGGLRISSTFNGSRNISVSDDGRFFVVCESALNRLTMYETATNRELWSLWMNIGAAVFANDMIYAVNPFDVFAIDNTGTIVKHTRLGGLDIAVDTKHDCLWIVGGDIKKFNLDLELKFKANLTMDFGRTWAHSVDVGTDGSIWIAEENSFQKYGGKNRLEKRSLYGAILEKIDLDFLPVRLRIDKYDGSVWVTGIIKERDLSGIGDEMPETLSELNDLIMTKIEAFTQKYDSEGNLIFEISEGGYSIELDQSDNSAWIAGEKNIWHYSTNGRVLSSYAGSSGCQKWLAIIPGRNSK